MTGRPGIGQVADPATWPAALAAEALEQCVDSFPEVVFTVTGGCMIPALHPGDRVLLRGLRESGPRVGDVLLVRSDGQLRLHRLVVGRGLARLARGYRTMADRARGLDPPLRRADILGRVVSREGRPLPPQPLGALRSLARAAWFRLRRALAGPR